MENIDKRKYWNIFKALSIIAVVIGHSCRVLVPFVYLFHLALFFFVAGYFYSEEKYGDNIILYFTNKIKANYKKFVLFTIFYILIHNILLKYGIIINTEEYHFGQLLSSIINTFILNHYETMSGALWFIPVYIAASTLFGSVIYFARKITSKVKGTNVLKNLIILYATILLAVIGVILNVKNITLQYHLQTIFIVAPLYLFGYYLKNMKLDLFKYLKIFIAIPVFAILYYLAYVKHIWITLADSIIGNPFTFYFAALLGVYFTLYLSKIILKIKFVSSITEVIGKYTFEIMATHFLVFKIIDKVAAKILHITDPAIYGKHPYAFGKLAVLYVILGIGVPTLIFYLYDKYKEGMKKKVKNIMNKIIEFSKNVISKLADNKALKILMVIAIILLVSLPVLKMGVIHNDELMSRLWSKYGFKTFYTHYFNEQLEKGRALSAVTIPFTMYLGYIGDSTYVFKSFQMLSTVICALLFGACVNHTLKNKPLAIVSTLIFMVLLPVTFEPTVPTVFVTFYNVSIALMVVSLWLYTLYLKNNNIKHLIISMVLYAICLVSYETFVTYVPVFMLLYLFKHGFKKLFEDKKGLFIPIALGVLYLVAYVVVGKLFPSNYDGNKIGGINILKSLEIIFNIVRYALPGGYITSLKYRSIFHMYYNITAIDIVRICALATLTFVTFVYALKKYKDSLNLETTLKLMLLGLALAVLPILPISVASMYQSMNIGTVTQGLPVSFFTYFGTCLMFGTLFIYLSRKFKVMPYILVPLVIAMVVRVQLMNAVVATQASENFKWLEGVEEFLQSEILEDLNITTIHSKDIFETKNAMAIHDFHWNAFAKRYELNIDVKADEGTSEDYKLYYVDEEKCFEIVNNEGYYIITKNDVAGKQVRLFLNDSEYMNDQVQDEEYKQHNMEYVIVNRLDYIKELKGYKIYKIAM